MTQWSTEQQAVFDWFERGPRGNLVVRARAGTGKTTTILEGVGRAPDPRILLAAFNKSIAAELQERVSNPRVEAKTLHGLGYACIRRNLRVELDKGGARAKGLVRGADLGKLQVNLDLAQRGKPPWALFVPADLVRLVGNIHTKVREVNPFARGVDDVVDAAVHFDLGPDEDWAKAGWNLRRCCEVAWLCVQDAKQRPTEIDFADMIFLPLVHGWVQPIYDLVVVDEAQDMTMAQLALATGSCKPAGRVCVVGDDRQAIYAWRGAAENSIDLLKDQLKAAELPLRTTYRCPKRIVALAAEIVPDYRAAPEAPDGEVTVAQKDKLPLLAVEGDFVLSRTNAPLARACMSLLKVGKRAKIKGKDIGKGVMALVNKLGATGIGDLVRKVEEWKVEEFKRAVETILDDDTRERRLDSVLDQRDLIVALCDGLGGVRELEARLEDLFSDHAGHQAVMCSTVHRAKGLEAERVFILEGTLRAGRTEEDNIRYVAITRTKHRLTWVRGYEKGA